MKWVPSPRSMIRCITLAIVLCGPSRGLSQRIERIQTYPRVEPSFDHLLNLPHPLEVPSFDRFYNPEPLDVPSLNRFETPWLIPRDIPSHSPSIDRVPAPPSPPERTTRRSRSRRDRAQPTTHAITAAPAPQAGEVRLAVARDVHIERALLFRNFLQTIRGDEMICHAMASLFEAPLPSNECAGRVFNKDKTVFYQVTTADTAGKAYEIELLGQSVELCLKVPRWVERHRFYVLLGFDGQLEPLLTVFDFEPMFRTTPDLFPVNDTLFTYITRENDSSLRAFQERIKAAISTAVQTALIAEAKK